MAISATETGAARVSATPSARSLDRAALPLLLAAFVLLGTCYAVVTPLFEVSDELWHFPMVKTISDGDGLPVQDPARPGPWRQEGSQPPLYYVLMALATHWIDTSDIDQVRWINPHADNGIVTPDGNNNIIIHTQRENLPWWGTVLAVRLIRFLSVSLAAVTVFFTYHLALEVLPDRRDIALAAAAFVAFTPMFVFVSASVNNDSLAIALSTMALWVMARWLRRGVPAGKRPLAAMGTLLGVAALSKVSTLGLGPLAGAVIIIAALVHPDAQARPELKTLTIRLGTVFGVALLVSGWWFVRNVLLYGDWLGWSAFLDTVGRRPHPATLMQLWGERVGFVQAYWGLFGGVSVAMPGWVYVLLNAVAAMALAGLLWRLAHSRLRRKLDLPQIALWCLLLAWVGVISVGLLRWTSLTWASQGRLVFPAIAALSLLAVVGLSALWAKLPWLVVTGMGLLTAAVPFAIIWPHYAQPALVSAREMAAMTHPLNAGPGVDFGGEMRLLGYDLPVDSAQPGQPLRLRLYWQAQIAMDRNWSIFVHLVDDQGVIVAQRDRYPGGGRLATTMLEAGQTFVDDFVLQLPPAAYAPTGANLEVGLYDLNDGARLPVAGGGDSVTIAAVAIAERPALSFPGFDPIPNPLTQNFANQVQLTGYAMGLRSLAPGQTLPLTLYWRALNPITVDYSVFAHVRGDGETLWAGQDHWPQSGAAPTSSWRPGELIVDTYELTLKPDTPPGQYDVEVGLYNADTLARLQAITPDGRPTDNDFVYLSRIRVTTP